MDNSSYWWIELAIDWCIFVELGRSNHKQHHLACKNNLLSGWRKCYLALYYTNSQWWQNFDVECRLRKTILSKKNLPPYRERFFYFEEIIF